MFTLFSVHTHPNLAHLDGADGGGILEWCQDSILVIASLFYNAERDIFAFAVLEADDTVDFAKAVIAGAAAVRRIYGADVFGIECDGL